MTADEFTLRIMIGKAVQLTEPGMTAERWDHLVPDLKAALPQMQLSGRVAILADVGNITHILGSYHAEN